MENSRRRFGDGVEALEADTVYHDSTAFSVLRIGVLSSHLSDRLRSAHDEIPWDKLIKMRVIRDFYEEGCSVEPLWDIIGGEAPKLKVFCQNQVEILEAREAEKATGLPA